MLSLVKEDYYGMTNRHGADFLYYVPADVFKEMASDQYLMSYSFDADVLNFINSVLTGIVTRQQEFAILEAIGMTKTQLSRMLVLEGLYYALGTIVFSMVSGCIFSVTVLRMLTGGMWFMEYHFVIRPMLVVFPFLLLLGFGVPKASIYFWKKASIVERLWKSE